MTNTKYREKKRKRNESYLLVCHIENKILAKLNLEHVNCIG